MDVDSNPNASVDAPNRRSIMKRLGIATALGVGASALFESTAGATGLTAMTAYNVRDYGALGNGMHNDAPAIQSAINAAAAAGGGLVFLPGGTYALNNSVTLKSEVHLLGSGPNATVLTLKAGINKAVLVSNAAGTIWGFSIRHLTIDGNKASNSAGDGINVDANDWIIDSVTIRNCAGFGLVSTNSNDNAGPDSMEAVLANSKVHDNDGGGIGWGGPHDSFWSKVLVFYNGAAADSVDGVLVTDNGFALFADQLHVYGGKHKYGLHVEVANTSFHNCQVEGAGTANVWIDANDFRYVGGFVYAGTNGANAAVGFQVGSAANNYIAAARIETAGVNLQGGVFPSFQYGPFNSVVELVYYTADGSGAYPAGIALPIRSYFNVVPAMSSLATEAQAQLSGWLALRSQTPPTVDLPDGGCLYTEGGALKYRGSTGTVTTIAPA